MTAWSLARAPRGHVPAVRSSRSDGGPAVERPRRGHARVQRRPLRAVQSPPHAPARAGEREVGHGGEAAARRRAARAAGGRCGRRWAGRGPARGRRSSAPRRPPGRTSSAPASPTSQTPSAPRSSTSPVRACRSRASWPTRSPSRPSAARSRLGASARARLGAQDVGPALGVELGDDPGVREAAPGVTGSASGSTANSTAPAPTNGTTCATVVSVHSARGAAQARLVHARAPVDGRSSGSGGARPRRRSAAGDRQAHDHEVGVDAAARGPARRGPRPW